MRNNLKSVFGFCLAGAVLGSAGFLLMLAITFFMVFFYAVFSSAIYGQVYFPSVTLAFFALFFCLVSFVLGYSGLPALRREHSSALLYTAASGIACLVSVVLFIIFLPGGLLVLLLVPSFASFLLMLISSIKAVRIIREPDEPPAGSGTGAVSFYDVD